MQNGLSHEIPQIESEVRKLTIVNGQFALRCHEGTEGAIARALTKGDNLGKEVHELLYPSLTGFISSGEIRKLPFGLSCEVTIMVGDEAYVVQFSSDSAHFAALATHLPNIDRRTPVSLTLVKHQTKTTSTGNPVIMLWVTQNNKRVEDYYVKWSKDEAGKNIPTHLHGLPEVKKTRQGWDFSDQENFYLEEFERYFTGGDQAETYTKPPAGESCKAPGIPVYNMGAPVDDGEPDMSDPMDDGEPTELPF